MPTQGSLTNAGAQGLMASGAPLSGYLQIGRDTLPVADWATAVAVPGAFRALPITRAIVATQTTIQTLDDDDAQSYDDLASIGFWNADPSTPGADLWWLGTAAAGEVLSVKTLNNDLIWTVALMLTPAQVANLSFNISIETVPAASETVQGITRYSTDSEDDAGAIDDAASTPKGVARYVAGWWNALTSLQLRNKIVMATAQQARAGSGTGVMTSELTKEAISALSPEATAAVKGQVELATPAELQAALGGANPPSGVEDNVPTLQALYARRGDFGPKHTRVAAAPTLMQIAASSPGDIWLQV